METEFLVQDVGLDLVDTIVWHQGFECRSSLGNEGGLSKRVGLNSLEARGLNIYATYVVPPVWVGAKNHFVPLFIWQSVSQVGGIGARIFDEGVLLKMMYFRIWRLIWFVFR